MTSCAISPEAFDLAAAIMNAIAHPIRLRILEVLERQPEANVTELCARCQANQPTVSRQLARMRTAGVLATRRDGTSVYYRVARREVLGILECIRKLEAAV
ncbi:MAG: ArsR/SmtB family transcription factor [Planctomycetota bacterium]|jgi:ArsR family transcriptional regulator